MWKTEGRGQSLGELCQLASYRRVQRFEELPALACCGWGSGAGRQEAELRRASLAAAFLLVGDALFSVQDASRMRCCSREPRPKPFAFPGLVYQLRMRTVGTVCSFVGSVNKVLVWKVCPFLWQDGGVRLDYSYRALSGSASSLSVA